MNPTTDRIIKRPVIVQIIETKTAYSGGTFDGEVMVFVETDMIAAQKIAADIVAKMNLKEYVTGPGTTATRPHRAAFRTACDVCKISGKKPGCKKKACEACAGYGTIAIGDAAPPYVAVRNGVTYPLVPYVKRAR